MPTACSRLAARAAALWLVLAAAPGAAETPASLAPLFERRQEIVARLAEPIAACVAREDTGHAAFHGCIDWHSAAHGAWALVAYERATGDRRHAAVVAAVLRPDLIAREREYLRAHEDFEMPYGRAWFLRLALDHDRLTGASPLLPMADEVARSVLDFIRAAGPDPWARDYDSHSWALVNLRDYAAHRGRADIVAAVDAIGRQDFVPIDAPCPLTRERGGFLAPCLTRALFVARLLDGEALSRWADEFLPGVGDLTPITDPTFAHEYGMNFSRAWGLWELHARTGQAEFADAFAAHFTEGYTDRSNWDGDYRQVGHWVAQFGIFALQPLFGGRGYR